MTETTDLPAIIAAPQNKLIQLQAHLTPADALSEINKLRAVVGSYLTKGEDYGRIPGTQKDCLFKSGAEKLCDIYLLYGDPTILEKTEDWTHQFMGYPAPLFDYTVRCGIHGRQNDSVYGVGLGSCNSYEKKYLWREGKRLCPECGRETLRNSKKEYGGGYYCDAKNGGCGSQWKALDGQRKASEEEKAMCATIDAQEAGRIVNDDLASIKNTVLKMAKKRAYVDGVISATRSSGIFTQDLEEFLDVQAKPVLPTNAEWEALMTDIKKRGVSRAQIKQFCKTEQAKGFSLDVVFTTCKAFYLEDDQEPVFDWDTIDGGTLDEQFNDRLSDPNA